MHAVSSHLFDKLIGKRLRGEVHEVLEMGKQGFDVRCRSESSLLLRAFEGLLERILEEEGGSAHVVHSVEELAEIRLEEMRARRFHPIILLASDTASSGAGLVDHPLPTLTELLPSTPHAVRIVLEHHGLGIFNEAFGPERLAFLKPLLTNNLSAFIDAVVQTAYLEGARGESARADAFLRTLRPGNVSDQEEELDVAMLARCLQWMVGREGSPILLAKALLSYFVVRVKGAPTTQASDLLHISRTTLQQHLALAEKMGVPEIFGRRPARGDSLSPTSQGAG